jgi:glycosyltransferase involved in cell wall biosynthesis
VHVAEAMPRCPVIYHCVDDFAGNPGVDPRAVARLEGRLLRRAAAVLATSRPLAERLRAMHRSVHEAPNVAEVERFCLPRDAPADLAALPRPVMGYVGNVSSSKVDTRLLAELAEARPQWSFALVGPVGGGDPATDLAALAGRPNVHLLGAKAYEDVPAYVQHFDVCMIPFRRSRLTEASLPLKTFEYLAAGKPVVSVPLQALCAEPLDGSIMYASDAATFAMAIECVLRDESPERAAARRCLAATYSWTQRYPELERIAAKLVGCSRPDAKRSDPSRPGGG